GQAGQGMKRAAAAGGERGGELERNPPAHVVVGRVVQAVAQQWLAAAGVPEQAARVGPAAEEQLAVAREGEGVHIIEVPQGVADRLAGERVPEAGCVVAAGGGEAGAAQGGRGGPALPPLCPRA